MTVAISTGIGPIAACAPCGSAFIHRVSTSSSGVERYFHPFTAPGRQSCPSCRRGTAQRNLLAGPLNLAGSLCEACDLFIIPLASLRPGPRTRERPAVVPLVKETPVEIKRIDERDRVFSFLLGLPLELTVDVAPRPPAVLSIMAGCILLFIAGGLTEGALSAALALGTNAVRLATSWQLLTSCFVHWGVLHLLGNMYFLFAFGRLPESRIGPVRLLTLFLVSGLAGNVLFLILNFGEDRLLAGASGGISGILGFYFVAFPSHRVGLSVFFTVLRVPAIVFLGLWFVLQIGASGGEEDPVAYAAHIGGFLAGIVLALAWRGTFSGARRSKPP